MPPKGRKPKDPKESAKPVKEKKIDYKIRNACIVINNWTNDDVIRLNAFSFRYMVIGREGKKCSKCIQCHQCFLCDECKILLTKIYNEGFADKKKTDELKDECIRSLPKCDKCDHEHCDKCVDKCLYKTPHLQCYVEFPNSIYFSSVCKQIPGGHVEPVRSSKALIRYCKKENDFDELGIPKAPGVRPELDEIRSAAFTGGMRDVTMIANASQLQVATSYLTYHEPGRKCKPRVFFIHGPAGTGKERLARAILERTTGYKDVFVVHPSPTEGLSDLYNKKEESKWWNGYDGHQNVIISEFRHTWWTIGYLLSLLDCDEFKVECKGGMRQFKGRNIIITSTNPPDFPYIYPTMPPHIKCRPRTEDEGHRIMSSCEGDPYLNNMFDTNGESSYQLLRRINEVIELRPMFDDNKRYIQHQASYVNYKIKGAHYLNGRKKSTGVVKFSVDPAMCDNDDEDEGYITDDLCESSDQTRTEVQTLSPRKNYADFLLDKYQTSEQTTSKI